MEKTHNSLINYNWSSHHPGGLSIHVVTIVLLNLREAKFLVQQDSRVVSHPDLEEALRRIVILLRPLHGRLYDPGGHSPPTIGLPHRDGDDMALPGRPQTLQLGEAPFDPAHDVTLDGAVGLCNNKSLWEPSVKIPVEERAVVLREALDINVPHPVQVVGSEPPDPETFVGQLQRPKPLGNMDLKNAIRSQLPF